jgi:eukaryotic-like serine/threonine-protein kinase
MVALGTKSISGPLGAALRDKLATTLAATPQARVVAMSVLRAGQELSMEPAMDAVTSNRHVARIVAMKHWAKSLGLRDQAISYHVPEASSPAEAILEYARANHVDHIIMGARTETLLQNLLGSVAGQVSAQAPCTVTVVRRREWPAAEGDEKPQDEMRSNAAI